MGLANQGETVLRWDRASGRPLGPALSWQDRRAVIVTRELAGRADRLTELTGLPLDPYFAAPKMSWLQRAEGDDGVITTVDAWLNQRLSGAFVTDAATASRTLLLDLRTTSWSPEACAAFGLDPERLPRIVDCAEQVGETSAFGQPLALTGLAVDQQAALLAQSCFTAGEAKCTYGTGAFILANAGGRPPRSPSGLAACVAWRLRGDHLLPGRPGPQRGVGGRLAGPGRPDRRRRGARPGRGRGSGRGVRARPGGPRRPFLGARRAGGLAGAVARNRPRRSGARPGVGHRGAGGLSGRCDRQGHRRGTASTAGRRRADPLHAADAGSGGPAAGARRVLPIPGRHRPRRGRAGAVGRRRRGHRRAGRRKLVAGRRVRAADAGPRRHTSVCSAGGPRPTRWHSWEAEDEPPANAPVRRRDRRRRRRWKRDRPRALALRAAAGAARGRQRRRRRHQQGQHGPAAHRLRRQTAARSRRASCAAATSC